MIGTKPSITRRRWASGFRPRLIARLNERSAAERMAAAMMLGADFSKTYWAKYPERVRVKRLNAADVYTRYDDALIGSMA